MGFRARDAVQVPDGTENTLVKFLKEVGGKIVSAPDLEKVQREEALLNQIEAGLKDVAAIRSGKIKRITLTEGLRG